MNTMKKTVILDQRFRPLGVLMIFCICFYSGQTGIFAQNSGGFGNYAVPEQTGTATPQNQQVQPQPGNQTVVVQPYYQNAQQVQNNNQQTPGNQQQGQGYINGTGKIPANNATANNVPGFATSSGTINTSPGNSSGQGGYITQNPQGNNGQSPDAAKLLPAPFTLKPEEQTQLNEFLTRWEQFGQGIKRVSCDVHVREYDGGVFHQDSRIPMRHTWGQFRYIAPNKLLFHIRGEFTYIASTQGEEPKQVYKPNSNETKMVFDGKCLTQYDFQKKVAMVFPIPEEERNYDLTMNNLFPVFFIAKADLLKEKFYLRIVTPADKIQNDVWIEAAPRFATDAQEYKSLIILMRLSDLQPYFLRKTNPNGKSHSDLEFQNIAINKGLWNVEATIDKDWTKKVEDPISLVGNKKTSGPHNPVSTQAVATGQPGRTVQ